ncbi:transglutaminase domain-containing protein [Paenibacillus sp. 481]|nr:transglutaminase domain-containing protein [Paenibacillus sp. 481]
MLTASVQALMFNRHTVSFFAITTILYLFGLQWGFGIDVADNVLRAFCWGMLLSAWLHLDERRQQDTGQRHTWEQAHRQPVRWLVGMIVVTAGVAGSGAILLQMDRGVEQQPLLPLQEWVSNLKQSGSYSALATNAFGINMSGTRMPNRANDAERAAIAFSGYSNNDSSLGMPVKEDNRVLFRATTPEPTYWRAESKSVYTGRGWEYGQSGVTRVKAADSLLQEGVQQHKVQQVRQRIIWVDWEPTIPLVFGGRVERLAPASAAKLNTLLYDAAAERWTVDSAAAQSNADIANRTGHAAEASNTSNNSNTSNMSRAGNTSGMGDASKVGNTSEVGNTGRMGDTGKVGNTSEVGNAGNVSKADNANDMGNTSNAGNAIDAGSASNQAKSQTLEYEYVTQVVRHDIERLHQSSTLSAAVDPIEKAPIREQGLALPSTLPERVRELARRVTFGAGSRYEQVQRVQHFLQRQYTYTMSGSSVPPQGSDFVDHFLFDQRQGYCTHFSSAMVVMLRTQGVPARWVKGFAPGEAEAPGQYAVRAANAHAWVEVYFPQAGWIAFEATPNAEWSNHNGTSAISSSNATRLPDMSSISNQSDTTSRTSSSNDSNVSNVSNVTTDLNEPPARLGKLSSDVITLASSDHFSVISGSGVSNSKAAVAFEAAKSFLMTEIKAQHALPERPTWYEQLVQPFHATLQLARKVAGEIQVAADYMKREWAALLGLVSAMLLVLATYVSMQLRRRDKPERALRRLLRKQAQENPASPQRILRLGEAAWCLIETRYGARAVGMTLLEYAQQVGERIESEQMIQAGKSKQVQHHAALLPLNKRQIVQFATDCEALLFAGPSGTRLARQRFVYGCECIMKHCTS